MGGLRVKLRGNIENKWHKKYEQRQEKGNVCGFLENNLISLRCENFQISSCF